MKTISGALQTLFATRQFAYCGLYQFSLIDTTQLYYASADTDILWSGQTYSAGGTTGPYFDRKDNKAKAHWKIGVEVDTLVFDVLPGTSTIEGAAFQTAVKEGIFDGAELTFSHAYWPLSSDEPYVTPIVPTGIIPMFVGRVAEVDASRTLATFTVNSHLELLNQNMPRNLYQSGCVNTLYDASCTLNQASFAVTGTFLTGSTINQQNVTMSQATGYFDLGKVVGTSGANNGISRGIQTYIKGSPGTINLMMPFPVAPANGDTFTAYPGCDKRETTCSTKFNNLANFRGFPFVPENSTAI
jgi:uncharacterized phage protein (TIGR02218 family)